MFKFFPCKIVAVVAVLAAVSACDMYVEDSVNTSRVQLKEDKFVEELPVSDVDKHYISALAQNYDRYGDGGLNLTVTYDPVSRKATAMKAGDEAVRIAGALRKQGVKDVKTNILPVRDYGDESMAVISYASYKAEAPADCGTMPGYDTTNIDHVEDYKLGCTVETVFARQIAKPKHLSGESKADPYSDGRRGSNVVEVYRTGVPNEPLKGQTASED